MSRTVRGKRVGRKSKPEIYGNPFIECACGCGDQIQKYYKTPQGRWKERIYIQGHQMRGHKRIDLTLRNISQRGKRLSPDTEFKKGSIPWNKGTLYGKNESLLRKIKQSVEYKEWRNKVYQKNGYKCQLCGDKKDLKIHHIISMKTIYTEFLERYIEAGSIELYKLSKDYSDFWNVDNGIVVCYKCHKKIHNWR